MGTLSSFDQWNKLCQTITDSSTYFNVDQWQVNGLDVWPLLKTKYLTEASYFYLADRPLQTPGHNKSSHMRTVIKKLVATAGGVEYIYYLRSLFYRFQLVPPKLKPDCSVLFLGDHPSFQLCDKTFTQKHIDPLRITLAANGFPSETMILDQQPGFLPETADSLWLKNCHFLTSTERYLRAYCRNIPVNLSSLSGFQAWKTYVSQKVDLPLETLVSDEQIKEFIQITLAWRNWFHKFLSSLTLRAIFQISYYRPPGYALNAVAKELQIPAVDIQHGFEGPFQYAYNYPNLPKSSFNTLPSHFITWNYIDRDHIKSWGANAGVTATTLGLSDDWLEAQFEQPQTKSLNVTNMDLNYNQWKSTLQNQLKTLCARTHAKKFLLLTTHYQEDISSLEPLFRYCKEQQMFIFWRVHPRESKSENFLQEREKQAAGYPIDIRLASSCPLVFILDFVDLHVTKYSASTLEATAKGVPTLVYSQQGWEVCKKLGEISGIYWIRTPQEWPTGLETLLRRKPVNQQNQTFPKLSFDELRLKLAQIIAT